MRSAIDKIAADGSVTREVGRGTFLRHDSRLDFMNVIQKLTGVSPIDMMAVRQIFEPRAAALAATNASASDLHEIAAAHAAAVEAVDMATFEHWDAELHQRIFAGVAQRTAQSSPRNPAADPQSGSVARHQATIVQPASGGESIARSTRRSSRP